MKTLIVGLLFGVAAFAQSASPKVTTSTLIAIVPFQLVANHLYVQATVNGTLSLSAVIDSGSPYSEIDKSRADELRIPTLGAVPLPGFGNEQQAGNNIIINNVDLHGASLEDIHGYSGPVRDVISPLLGHTTDAIIGSDLFKKYVVEVDYFDKVLRLYDSASYIAPQGGCQLPLLVDDYPRIHAQLTDNDGNLVDAIVVIDTGAPYLILTKSFGDEHPLLASQNRTIDGAPRRVSGETHFRVGRIRAIKLGGCVVQTPVIFISEDSQGSGLGNEGLSAYVGGDILQQFTTVFDYRHHLVTFTRNRGRDMVSQYDMTGMHICASGPSFHDFTVDFVLKNSPAERRGIQVGDKIDSANRIPASRLTLDELYQMFMRKGSLRLTMSRNGVRKKEKLKLKPLI